MKGGIVMAYTIKQLEEKIQKLENENERLESKYKAALDLYNETLKALETQRLHNNRGGGRKPKLTPEVVEQVQALRQIGKTYPDIAATLGLAVGTVYKACQRP